jgi:hypothetical protein
MRIQFTALFDTMLCFSKYFKYYCIANSFCHRCYRTAPPVLPSHMSAPGKSFTHLIGLLLLTGGLTACADYTGPDGSRINGPQVRENGSTDRTLSYTVEGFNPRDITSRNYMRHLAREAVEEDGHTGMLSVLFLDKTSGNILLASKYEVIPDLLFQNKIHRL